MGTIIQGRAVATAERIYSGRSAGFWWVAHEVPGFVQCGAYAVIDDFGDLVRVSRV